MTNLKLFTVLFLVLVITSCTTDTSYVFHMNSLGYLPTQSKIIAVSNEFSSFQVVDSNNQEVVFEGKATASMHQEDVDMTVWKADFSDLSTPGTYYIKTDNNKKSEPFTIAADVYNDAYKTAMRGFYLWRCGTEVAGDYNGEHYTHEACHLEDGWLDSIGVANQQKDGVGGWHDAGDHGKYVVNAGITVGMLFMAWDQYEDKLAAIDLDLPETAPGFPDYLKELKWETDWILKMQYPDGSGRVSHKLTRTNFSGFIMPEDDNEKRYFTEWSSAATADFVAMMAQAARYFQPYDEAYAEKCLEAARISYQFLLENPEHKRFSQRFGTGGYQSKDKDDRLWAAAEMWETTGEQLYLDDFESQLGTMDQMVDENWDWGNVKNMGTYTYILSEREGRDPEMLSKAKAAAVEIADQIVGQKDEDIFDRPLGTRYYWGCNGTIVRQVLNLYVANQIHPNQKYTDTALEAIHNVFGKNQYARSFVTGVGINPPMFPHDRRSGADSIVAPWPGYLVGGGQNAVNWQDVEASYSTNEIAINWQGALVYALAGFID